MAVTTGHGNPKWTREEVILALDLYLECGLSIPSASDPRVKALSETLRAFPHHSAAARKASFRNADGVAFKLQNLRQVSTGLGLGNVSKTDRAVWEELGSSPNKVKELAALIRAGLDTLSEVREDQAEYETFAEGHVVTETHLRRERSPVLRTRLIDLRKKQGRFACEICARKPNVLDNTLADAIYEAHHVVPLAIGDERVTKIADMALLCACCHRLIHKAIVGQKRWLSILEARKLIYGYECTD
ncbi:HNH endonuclease [Pseudomonas sp. zfem001]|uniref:HNH endonuclease signature motif containing protein n=1 Tax=Pseudomonas sp. zfem001 TaxID=3078196 RepID=UPI002927EC98|nr:HNH endonuclease [Pseudomonas sp. zfem001]MDU9409008.1 HNH endonuclease [Pseudomonas sp. zfem001]